MSEVKSIYFDSLDCEVPCSTQMGMSSRLLELMSVTKERDLFENKFGGLNMSIIIDSIKKKMLLNQNEPNNVI